MESKGFSPEDAGEIALQFFNWGMRAAFVRLRPSGPLPPDLPAEVHEVAAQLTLLGEIVAQPKVAKPRKKSEPDKQPHRLPGDFDINEDRRRYAVERAFSADEIREMWDAFRDHHRMHGKEFVDWNAAWQNWVRNQVRYKTRDGRGPRGPGDQYDGRL